MSIGMLFFCCTESYLNAGHLFLSFVFNHFENLEDEHMSENKKYTIVIKRQRVEVKEAVYSAYHKEREAERCQNKLIRQN